MSRSIRIALSVLTAAPSLASARLRTDAFLSSAGTAPSVQYRRQNRLDAAGFLNPIDKMQLSYEGNGKKADEREFGLKISPRGFSEYGIERRLRRQQDTAESLALRKEIGKALEERYLALIDHAMAGTRAGIQRELLKLSEREVAVTTAATRASKADARDLMKAREGHEQLKVETADVEAQLSASVLKLKSLDPSVKDTELTMDDLIVPFDAAKNLPADGEGSDVEVELAREEAAMARGEYEYGVAKTGRLIDSLGVKMEQKNDENVYTFEVTLNVPGFVGGDYSSRERSRKAVEAEIDANEVTRFQAGMLRGLHRAFEKSLASYKLFVDRGGGAARKLSDRLKKLARREDPSLLLLVQRNELEERLKRSEAAAEALRTYVQILSVTGTLARNEKTDYLAPASGSAGGKTP